MRFHSKFQILPQLSRPKGAKSWRRSRISRTDYLDFISGNQSLKSGIAHPNLTIVRDSAVANSKFYSGQILIPFLIFMAAGALMAGVLFSSVSYHTLLTGREVSAEKASSLADAGINRALYELNKSSSWSGISETSLGEGSYEVVIVSSSSNQIILDSTGYTPNKAHYKGKRRVRLTLMQNTTGVSFNYGVETGQGGFNIQNSAKVNGSVYANGNIVGANSAAITGDAFAAGTSTISGMNSIGGNARAHSITSSTITGSASSTTNIDGSTISGNAFADTLTNCTITGDAYYYTGISGCTVNGTKHASSTSPTDLPAAPYPISDAQVTQWENDAADGGTYSGSCPYNITSGTVHIGPEKIPCDFNISNSSVVILDGTVWVQGNFVIKNSAIMELNSSYGSNGGEFIVDNPNSRATSSEITVMDSAQVLGSGVATSSYLLLVSENNSASTGGSEVAVNPGNSSNSSVFFAPYGELDIANSVSLREVTAYLISMKNSAQLNYQSGLANSNFTSGPSGGWSIEHGTWQIKE